MSKLNLGLLIMKDIDNNYGQSTTFAHIRANVITFDAEDNKPRNLIHSSIDMKDYQYFDGLVATCQMDSCKTDDGPYGFNIEYRDIHSAQYNKINKMAKTLKKIHNKMNKMDDEIGRPKSFGEFVIRFAKAIGVKTIVFHDDYENINPRYPDNSYQYVKNMNESIELIDDMASELQKKLANK